MPSEKKAAGGMIQTRAGLISAGREHVQMSFIGGSTEMRNISRNTGKLTISPSSDITVKASRMFSHISPNTGLRISAVFQITASTGL